MEKHTRGQSTLEYVVLIAVVAATVLIAQYYVKHAVTGRLKSSADSIGDQWDLKDSTFEVEVKGFRHSKDFVDGKGVSSSHLAAEEEQSREITKFEISKPTSATKLFDF